MRLPVVDRDLLEDGDLAGIGVDLDDGDLDAGGIVEVLRIEGGPGLEPRFHALRPVGALGCDPGQVIQREPLARHPSDGDGDAVPLEVLDRGLKVVGGQRGGLVPARVRPRGTPRTAVTSARLPSLPMP